MFAPRSENITMCMALQQNWVFAAAQLNMPPVFVRLDEGERYALRAQDFAFYDWGDDAARFVTAWDTREEHATALGKAIAAL